MPRFMGFVRMEEGVGTPPQALFDAMDTYIGDQTAKGVFVDGGGLYGTEDAVNFVVRNGEVSRVDGPYAEALSTSAASATPMKTDDPVPVLVARTRAVPSSRSPSKPSRSMSSNTTA